MCLIAFAFNYHPRYPLILAGNRDEFYDRKARPAQFWDTSPTMLAGKDLRAGGTWLGVTERGEFSALTNYRNLNNPIEGDHSRGDIIPKILTKRDHINLKVEAVKQELYNYSGFNLLAGNSKELFYLNNINSDFQKVTPGIHGLSNAFLDTSWPKVEKAKSALKKAINIESDQLDYDAMLEMLQNKETYPKESLPKTGLSTEMEKAVSPIFIETEGYGTRCSTLLTIDNSGCVHFIEKTYPVDDQNEGSNSELVREYTFETDLKRV